MTVLRSHGTRVGIIQARVHAGLADRATAQALKLIVRRPFAWRAKLHGGILGWRDEIEKKNPGPADFVVAILK